MSEYVLSVRAQLKQQILRPKRKNREAEDGDVLSAVHGVSEEIDESRVGFITQLAKTSKSQSNLGHERQQVSAECSPTRKRKASKPSTQSPETVRKPMPPESKSSRLHEHSTQVKASSEQHPTLEEKHSLLEPAFSLGMKDELGVQSVHGSSKQADKASDRSFDQVTRKRNKTRSKQKNIRKDHRPQDQRPPHLQLGSEMYTGRQLSEQTLTKLGVHSDDNAAKRIK
jgi:hypothetical protein